MTKERKETYSDYASDAVGPSSVTLNVYVCNRPLPEEQLWRGGSLAARRRFHVTFPVLEPPSFCAVFSAVEERTAWVVHRQTACCWPSEIARRVPGGRRPPEQESSFSHTRAQSSSRYHTNHSFGFCMSKLGTAAWLPFTAAMLSLELGFTRQGCACFMESEYSC